MIIWMAGEGVGAKAVVDARWLVRKESALFWRLSHEAPVSSQLVLEAASALIKARSAVKKDSSSELRI